jgi:hypothetical protein
MFQREIGQYTCLLGTMVQEVYATHPEVRAACDRQMSDHVAELVKDLDAAKQLYAPDAPRSAQGVGYFMQAVLQGAFIFAKAKQGPEVALECFLHLRRYLEHCFTKPGFKRRRSIIGRRGLCTRSWIRIWRRPSAERPAARAPFTSGTGTARWVPGDGDFGIVGAPRNNFQ